MEEPKKDKRPYVTPVLVACGSLRTLTKMPGDAAPIDSPAGGGSIL